VEGEKEEQEKVERKKPCTTTMIYRYRILNTSAWELRGDNGEKDEGGGMGEGG
jgi:hypothetical protein